MAPADVLEVADRFGATPFDIEGVHWSHRDDRCTFDVMIEEFKLASEPMSRLADIVRGADTNRHDIAPEAAGLLAISLGLSRMYRDDLAQLDAGMVVYDALYRWARDAVDEPSFWGHPYTALAGRVPAAGLRGPEPATGRCRSPTARRLRAMGREDDVSRERLGVGG